MTKPIRPAYAIFNHKESFFEQKKENIRKSGSMVNIYIVYSLSQKTIDSDNVLKNCLFGAIKVTKPGDTTDTDKYIYSGYGLGFDSMGQFSHSQAGMARNINIWSKIIKLSTCYKQNTKHFNTGSWSNSKSK